MENVIRKRCPDCKADKEAPAFYKCASCKSGLSVYCKECHRKRVNPTKRNARQREWAQRNPIAIKRNNKRAYEKFVDNEQHKLNQKKWREANADKIKQWKREWYENN